MTDISIQSLILIGGGGHAKVVYDALKAQGGTLSGYIDPNASTWLQQYGVPMLTEAQLTERLGTHPKLVMGFVGLNCDSLERRYTALERHMEQGAVFPIIIHPSAVISPSAMISPGVQVMAGAVINSHARIGEGAIINTGAVVEHDAQVGAGVHIAPRAVVLGGAQVGEISYIGSGAVIVQQTVVARKTFVKALRVHK